MKNILFIGATHGDEPIGVKVLKMLENKDYKFDWIIGNVPAYSANSRNFEGDLNRSAPGDIKSNEYAAKRAAEIIALSESYDHCIDIHGTHANTGIFIIITKPTLKNLELAMRLDIEKIVLWPSFSKELNGPLSEYMPCGIEIECGPKDDHKTQDELFWILESFLKKDINDDYGDKNEKLKDKKFFQVYDSQKIPSDISDLEEFTLSRRSDEEFYPLLIGRYQNRNSIAYYKMREIKEPLKIFIG
ncbi:MAG: succinylglutamate desuccinylase/aspartoacylase family protein [Patescibacteria group bacterium]|nr:succinylglutamate desuccinylase/aspartoacylase family protein [Patescibacteria group bacterium]